MPKIGVDPGRIEYITRRAYDANDRVEYVGQARPGVASDAVGWRIQEWTRNAEGRMTFVGWADGTDAFTKIWDSRADYTYS